MEVGERMELPAGVTCHATELNGETAIRFDIVLDDRDRLHALSIPAMIGAGPLLVFLAFFQGAFRRGDPSFFATEIVCGLVSLACALWCWLAWKAQPREESLLIRREGDSLVMENPARASGKARRVLMSSWHGAWLKKQYMNGALMYAQIVLSAKASRGGIAVKEELLSAPLALRNVSKLAVIHRVILAFIGVSFPQVEVGYDPTGLPERARKTAAGIFGGKRE